MKTRFMYTYINISACAIFGTLAVLGRCETPAVLVLNSFHLGNVYSHTLHWHHVFSDVSDRIG